MKKLYWRAIALASAAGLLYAAYSSSIGHALPAAVRVVDVDSGAVSSYIRATGTVSSVRDVRVATSIGGRVDEVHVAVGSTVSKGQRLIRLSSEEAALQLAADELAVVEIDTEITQHERSLSVLRTDFKAGAEPRERVTLAEERLALDRVQRRRAVAKADLSRLRIRDSVITAPISGMVTEVDVRPGEVAQASKQMITLIENGTQQILARMEQGDAQQVQPGMVARISLDGATGLMAEEKVLRIEPAVRKEGNADFLAVWISLTPSPLKLRPNQQVDVRLLVGTRSAVNRIPLEALVTTNGKASVWVVEGGRLHSVPLIIGMIGDSHVEVVSGLQAGQTVVVLDGKALKEGDSVTAARASGKS